MVQRREAGRKHRRSIGRALRNSGQRGMQGEGRDAGGRRVGYSKDRVRSGHGGVGVVVHGCLSLAGSGLATARIAQLRQYRQKKLPCTTQQNVCS